MPSHLPAFVPFGPAHLIALAAMLGVPIALAAATHAIGGRRFARLARWTIAAILIGTWILWFWLIDERGWISPQTILPMHLCDWAAIACIYTLINPNQRTYEVAYFWALAGTLQASLTPELAYGFPDLRFMVFFLFHGGVIAAVLYMTFGLGMRPYPKSIPRVVLWTFIYAGAAGLVDWVFDVNFGYLRHKPFEPSLLDMMAPWPWYIGELVVLGMASILLYYLPFFLIDRVRGPRMARAA